MTYNTIHLPHLYLLILYKGVQAGTPVLQSGGQLFRVQSTTGNRLVSLGQNSGGRVMVGRNQNVQLINKPIQPIQQQVIEIVFY